MGDARAPPQVSDAQTGACLLAKLPNGLLESLWRKDDLVALGTHADTRFETRFEFVLAQRALVRAIGQLGERTRIRLSIRNWRA